MDDLHDTLAWLTASLETLEHRVSALEHPSQVTQPTPVPVVNSSAAVQRTTALPFAERDGALSVVGKAMLGIAGAYLLRAMAESTTFPRAAVVAVAIAYAVIWLIAATQVKTEARFASIAYAGTSVLILVPMLWELTLRFRALPTAVTAGVLSGFVVAAFALAWKRHFAVVVWIITAAASTAALVMSIATHDLAPFIVALLVMAIVSESAAAANHRLRVRWWLAVSADVAVWAMIYIFSRPESTRMEYREVSGTLLLTLGPILLLIYAASTTSQTIMRSRRITFFEASQTLVAFLLAAWSMLAFRSGAGAILLGILCLLSSVAGYALVFARFGATTERRNFHVYGAGSTALFLVGVYLFLPPIWLIPVLAMAAIVTTIVGVRTEHLTPEFHGLVFLWAAAFSSGLLAYVFHAIAGAFPPSPEWLVWCISFAAVLCYAVERRVPAEQWKHRLLYLLSATLAVGATTALLAWALVRLVLAGITPGASHIAIIRTLTTCSIALALAYSGPRWKRKELEWLAYAALVFVASKLLFEDMRHSHLGFTAISICLYAITLLLVPHLVRLGQKARGAVRLEAPT